MHRPTHKRPPAAPHQCGPAGTDPELVIEAFLADRQPGVITWSNLDDGQNCAERAAAGQEVIPFPVWVTSVGTASR
ncbi:hypothetical protein DXZ75_08090 [Streptomyces sp. AcE210]|nr:hypothetical protein DXZ75_08090 [Streptomyces sp. AcE210]